MRDDLKERREAGSSTEESEARKSAEEWVREFQEEIKRALKRLSQQEDRARRPSRDSRPDAHPRKAIRPGNPKNSRTRNRPRETSAPKKPGKPQ